jgi:hypothetical protein
MTALNFPDSPTDGEEFSGYVWSDSDNVWNRLPEAPGINLGNLGDVNITPAAGDSLIYDGNNWLNTPQKNRNLLYNGAMQVHQRGTSTTGITTTGYYTADRWSHSVGSMGTWTDSVENDAPTGSGFRKSWKTLCTTADAAPAAGDALVFQQIFEGQDLQRIRKGTSSAQQLTLSFWVKSNVTGTYATNLLDEDNTRQVGAQYTISASGTWEKKTITFPADTTGAFDNDNAASFRVQWWLGAGSNFTSGTFNTTWASTTNANRAVGQTNLAAATNNYWQITGVQLEVGDTATEFEFKSYNQEIAECQRYYVRFAGFAGFPFFGLGSAASSTAAFFFIDLPVRMRAAPTTLDIQGLQSVRPNGATVSPTGAAIAGAVTTDTNATIDATGSGYTAGEVIYYRGSSATGFIGFSAEL